jgi:hypothetical protein
MHISDDLMLGPAVAAGSGINSAGPSPMEQGVGPMGRVYIFDSVPLTLQAAGLAAPQAVAGAGNLTLTAGTGVTASTLANGTVIYTLDTARSVSAVSASAGDTTQTVTVYGYDQYGQAMSQAVTLNGTTTVKTTKMFKSVYRIAISAAAAGNISAGYGDDFGLPLRLLNLGYVVSLMWNGAAVTVNSSNVGVADTTSPATTATTDVRGYVKEAGLTGGADGTKRLVMCIAVPAIACGPSATRVGAYGVTQV